MFGEQLLVIATSFPAVIYTVLFGVSLTYWLLVVLGSLPGIGGGELEGGAKGILEGGAKGILEGGVKGVLEGGAASIDGAADGVASAFDGAEVLGAKGAMDGLASRQSGKKAPVTVLLSAGFTLSWMFACLAMQALGLDASLLWKLAVLALAPVAGFVVATPMVRPLGRLFGVHPSERAVDLRGQVAVVTTGRVDSSFGQAVLERNGADLLVQVRAPAGSAITRGSRVLLVDFNEQAGTFEVEPMTAVLTDAPMDTAPIEAEEEEHLAERRSSR